jgi:hypothetical protein
LIADIRGLRLMPDPIRSATLSIPPKDAGLFVSQRHPGSRRRAIVEDDGRAAWLYLTRPDSSEPIADCWLYNRVPAPAGCEAGQDDPRVVPASHVASPAPFPATAEPAVQLRWSEDGESVAVSIDGRLAGFIANAAGPGYSAQLRLGGAFGNVLDDDLYAALFEVAAPSPGRQGRDAASAVRGGEPDGVA